MKLKVVKKSAMIFALSTSFILPQAPKSVLAQDRPVRAPLNLFPIDEEDDTGLFPPVNPGNNNGNNGNNNGNGNGGGIGVGRPGGPNQGNKPGQVKVSMFPAKVPATYSCPLFDNRPNSELFAAIDALDKEIKTSPECTGTPSAQTLETNGNTIKNSINTLQNLLQSQDPSAVTATQIDQSVTAAITAAGSISEIINNSKFLNSKCGVETMSSGKVLLALNDVINGLSPYALLAVSMNASLSPALPYVIGGAIVSSGISALTKMAEKDSLKMTVPEHRKAVLQNTCQFTKIAKKIRFMQLAQSGKIETITQELEKNIDFYKARFSNPTQELTSLIAYKETKQKVTQAIEDQLSKDRGDLNTIDTQVASNSDDLMICTLSNELVNWAKDGSTFPSSVFNNLEEAVAQGDRTQKLQALTLKALHATSIKKIEAYAVRASEDENALKACGQAGRSWLKGIHQSIDVTSAVLNRNKADLEAELSQNKEYRQWAAQTKFIRNEKITIKRVEKAMQELAKDDSVIDRSELAQRLADLKAGLFGTNSSFSYGKPPVQAWIDHTKEMHDQSIASLTSEIDSLIETYKGTPSGRSLRLDGPYMNREGVLAATILKSIDHKKLQRKEGDVERICQKLDTAWLHWSAALSHIGALQFFCDMIDPVLDSQMDADIVKACRDDIKSSGFVNSKSIVSSAKETLLRKGYRDQANLISQKLKELECPMPSVSVMNNN